MKRLVLLLIFALGLFTVPAFAADDDDNDSLNHGEVGAFLDMFRVEDANTNMFGIGGRLGFNVASHAQLEAEVAYDFERSSTEDVTVGGVTNRVKSNWRTLHGLFGPKFNFSKSAVRPFIVLKGGFVNFSVSHDTALGGFTGAFGNLADGDTRGVFYPGGGLEFFAGPVGIRLEAGDEIYFLDGAHNNLRLSVGPQFRF